MAWVLAGLTFLCLRGIKPSAAFTHTLNRSLHTKRSLSISASSSSLSSSSSSLSSLWPNLSIRGDAALVSRVTSMLRASHALDLASLPVPVELGLFDGRLGVNLPNSGFKPMSIDLSDKAVVSRASDAASSSLVRALRGGSSSGAEQVVFDLTAGLGRDASTAARMGMKVVMFERHPIVWAMLSDALERLANAEPEVAARMRLVCADAAKISSQSLRELQLPAPDVVFLDPMYAPRTKSAKVKKDMQVLHLLLGPPGSTSEQQEQDEALFSTAGSMNARRIVVKRQLNAPTIVHSAKPSGTIKGSTQRFDIYSTNTPQFETTAT